MLATHDTSTDKNVVKMPPRYRGVKNAEDAMTVIRNAIYEHGDTELLANRIGGVSVLHLRHPLWTHQMAEVAHFLRPVVCPRSGNDYPPQGRQIALPR